MVTNENKLSQGGLVLLHMLGEGSIILPKTLIVGNKRLPLELDNWTDMVELVGAGLVEIMDSDDHVEIAIKRNYRGTR